LPAKRKQQKCSIGRLGQNKGSARRVKGEEQMIKFIDVRNGIFLRYLPWGGTASLLLFAWLLRAEVQTPGFVNGAIFKDCDLSDPTGMADIEIYDLKTKNADLIDASVNDPSAVYGAGNTFFSKKTSSKSSGTAPSIMPPSRHNSALNDKKAGLFDDSGLDPFSKSDSAFDTRSWGWLSDDIKKTESIGVNSDIRNRSQRRERMLLFGDDNEERPLGRRFGSDRNDDSGFYRMDRRW